MILNFHTAIDNKYHSQFANDYRETELTTARTLHHEIEQDDKGRSVHRFRDNQGRLAITVTHDTAKDS